MANYDRIKDQLEVVRELMANIFEDTDDEWFNNMAEKVEDKLEELSDGGA